MALTFVCVDKAETRSQTTFGFLPTDWFDDADDVVAWHTEHARPIERGRDERIILRADDEEFEVGRHYAFDVVGPLPIPGGDDGD